MTQQALHDCKTELRDVELKATPTRLAVLKLLEKADKPLDVASIQRQLNNLGINADPATVFRMMNSFSDKGLVNEINFGENKLRYEYAEKKPHHHLICQNCGSVEDISDCNISGLEKDIQKKKRFIVKHHSLEFFGLCKNCQN